MRAKQQPDDELPAEPRPPAVRVLVLPVHLGAAVHREAARAHPHGRAAFCVQRVQSTLCATHPPDGAPETTRLGEKGPQVVRVPRLPSAVLEQEVVQMPPHVARNVMEELNRPSGPGST